MENMIECECGGKKFGYTDSTNIVYICYKCGRFNGKQVDAEFSEILEANPLVLLTMIEEKYLVPIK
jgi:hypothetical protein